MPKYIVFRKEVHVSEHEVTAKTPEHAIEKVKNGEGEEIVVTYSHTIEDGWSVHVNK